MRPRAQRDGFLVQAVGDQLVVFDQRRQQLHVLSRTTAAVWRHCDGRHTTADLVELVRRELGIPADEHVIALALEQLDEARLIVDGPGHGTGTEDLSRRRMLQVAASLAVGVLVPSITSCGSPLAPDAAASALGGGLRSAEDTTTSTSPFATTTTSTSLAPTTTTSTTIVPTTTTSTTLAPTTTTSTTLAPTTTTSTTSTTSTTTTPAPRKVQMCQNGHTIEVDAHAVPGLLRAGATMGPCPQ